jgi:hypothetical protein
MKGYYQRKQVMKRVAANTFETNFAYFAQLRTKLEQHAYNIITLHWLRYLARKIDRMEKEFQAQMEQELKQKDKRARGKVKKQ